MWLPSAAFLPHRSMNWSSAILPRTRSPAQRFTWVSPISSAIAYANAAAEGFSGVFPSALLRACFPRVARPRGAWQERQGVGVPGLSASLVRRRVHRYYWPHARPPSSLPTCQSFQDPAFRTAIQKRQDGGWVMARWYRMTTLGRCGRNPWGCCCNRPTPRRPGGAPGGGLLRPGSLRPCHHSRP